MLCLFFVPDNAKFPRRRLQGGFVQESKEVVLEVGEGLVVSIQARVTLAKLRPHGLYGLVPVLLRTNRDLGPLRCGLLRQYVAS